MVHEVIQELKDTVMQLKGDLTASKFCIENMTSWSHFTQSSKVKILLWLCGTAVNNLMYWEGKDKDVSHGKSQALFSFNEFFGVSSAKVRIVWKILANCFNISVSTVCCIAILRFKEIPLWSSQDSINYACQVFKKLCLTTRVKQKFITSL